MNCHLPFQWDLVCDQKSLTKTSSTIFFVGVMMGALAFGFLSDKYMDKTISLCSANVVILFFMFQIHCIDLNIL